MELKFDKYLVKSGESPIDIEILLFNESKFAFLRIDNYCYPISSGYIEATMSTDNALTNVIACAVKVFSMSDDFLDYIAIDDSIWRIRTTFSIPNDIFWVFKDFKVTDSYIEMFIGTRTTIKDVGSYLTRKNVRIDKESNYTMTIWEDTNPKNMYGIEHDSITFVEAEPLEIVLKKSVFGF